MITPGIHPRLIRRCYVGILLSCVLAATAEVSLLTSISGDVESGDTGLGAYGVELFATRSLPHADAHRLGGATTSSNGRFRIDFEMPSDPNAVLYLVARRGAVALAAALVASPNPLAVVAPRTRRARPAS